LTFFAGRKLQSLEICNQRVGSSSLSGGTIKSNKISHLKTDYQFYIPGDVTCNWICHFIYVHEQIGSVTADGAYDTRECHDVIADHGAYAVIPPRENRKPSKAVTAGAVARNEALRASKYLGRALW
jgi:hypothetical protein